MKKLFLFIMMSAIIIACKKTELPSKMEQEPATTMARGGGSGGGEATSGVTVTTTDMYVTSAIKTNAFGSVAATKKYTITERGFCFSLNPGPTISNDTARAGSGTGNFSKTLTSLTSGTTYYAKAYARTSTGVVYYGSELSFTTFTIGMPGPGVGTVNDIDGNVYNTITLGTQVWMVENFKATRFNDGTPIPNIISGSDWTFGTTPGYCDYDHIPATSNIYGRLYNKYAANDTRIAPLGWRLPTRADWDTVFRFLGGADIAGGRMKEAGYTHWLAPNTNADNSSQFTAIGSGYRYGINPPSFHQLQQSANLWMKATNNFGYIRLSYDSGTHTIYDNTSNADGAGFSIRLVKNN